MPIYHASAMRVAIAQMTASCDLQANLAEMRSYAETAKKQGAEVVAFPEMAYFIGHAADCAPVLPKYKEVMKTVGDWAKELKIDILPGSLREPVGTLPCRQYNSLPYFDSSGKLLGKYRKIFLFRAELPDRAYDETQYYNPGNEVVVVPRPWGKVGLAICFDVRFPELFRALKKRGAQVIFIPAAFAVHTGKVHWHTLLKARAIENQCFVIAPALTGKCGDERETFGHSLIISPWGEVIKEMGKEKGVLTCDISIDAIEKHQSNLDSWACRRDDLFPLP